MNMCTVQSIKNVIQEKCQSQHDMESVEIDRILQALPFAEHKTLFDWTPMPKRPYRPRKNKKNI